MNLSPQKEALQSKVEGCYNNNFCTVVEEKAQREKEKYDANPEHDGDDIWRFSPFWTQ